MRRDNSNDVVSSLITVPRLRIILRKLNPNTPLGADRVSMTELEAATDERVEALCQIMREAVNMVTLPIQAMHTMLFLIGKEAH